VDTVRCLRHRPQHLRSVGRPGTGTPNPSATLFMRPAAAIGPRTSWRSPVSSPVRRWSRGPSRSPQRQHLADRGDRSK